MYVLYVNHIKPIRNVLQFPKARDKQVLNCDVKQNKTIKFNYKTAFL